MEKKPFFAKGMYDKDDKNVKLINKLIIGGIAVVVILIVFFTINGGLTVSFDTDGGSRVESQVRKYGKTVEEPDIPVKEGYEFVCWSSDPDGENKWNFSSDEVKQSMTLYAVWKEK